MHYNECWYTPPPIIYLKILPIRHWFIRKAIRFHRCFTHWAADCRRVSISGALITLFRGVSRCRYFATELLRASFERFLLILRLRRDMTEAHFRLKSDCAWCRWLFAFDLLSHWAAWCDLLRNAYILPLRIRQGFSFASRRWRAFFRQYFYAPIDRCRW